MVIPGLLTRIPPDRLPKKRLHDTRFVIDAHNVFHILSAGIDNSYGGEFQKIAENTDKFLRDLAECNIEPVFVYIGTHNAESRERLLRKNADRIRQVQKFFQGSKGGKAVFPILGRLAFNNVLLEHGVKQVTTDHVDEVTAITALANKLGCPVMSSSTEYMVSNLEHGLAMVSDFRKAAKFLDGTFSVSFYHIQDFSKRNHLSGPFDVALMAAGVKYYHEFKNEFSSEMPAPHEHKALVIRQQIEQIRSIRSKTREENIRIYAESLDQEETEECQEFLTKTIDQYLNVQDSLLYDFLQDDSVFTKICDYKDQELPEWFRKVWMQGNMPRYLCSILITKEVNLPCQMEDVDQTCSFDCSEPIRQVSYGILTSGEDPGLTEYRRTDAEATYHPIEPKTELENYGELPTLAQIPGLGDKKKLVLNALGLPDNWADNLSQFDEDWSLFVAISVYWVRSTQPSQEHVKAVLLTAMKLRIHDRLNTDQEDLILKYFRDKPSSEDKFTEPGYLSRETERATLQHPFCQFQACFLDTNQLNELILQPFRSAKPELCFSGILAFKYLKDMKNGKSIDNFLSGRYREFFNKFLEIILNS